MNAGRNVGVTILVVFFLLLAGVLLYREFMPAGYGRYGYGYGGHMMGGMGMGWLMIVFWGLVLFGLILMINWLLAAVRSQKRDDPSSCDALGILKRRFAGGEIDRNQYEQMRKALSE